MPAAHTLTLELLMFLQGHKRRLHLLALSDTRFVILYGGGNASPSLAQLGSFRSAKELWVEKARFEFGPKRLDHFATATLSESLFVVSRSPPNPPSKGRPSLHVYCEGEVAMCYPHALLVIWRSPCEAAPATNRWPRVLKAATSKAGPMRQQDRILKRLQDGRAPSSRGLQGGEALLLSTDAAGNRIPNPNPHMQVVYADAAAKDAATLVVGRVDDDGLLTFSAPTQLGNGTAAVGVAVCALVIPATVSRRPSYGLRVQGG
jgi:hypothetical protein